MTATRTYPPGVPCWIDTDQPDPEAARHFYGRLLDWTFEEIGPEPGTALLAFLSNRPVAAISKRQSGPAVWNTLIATDDVEASCRLVTEHGGAVVLGPGDVGTLGRLAECTDPDGAVFRLWQAGDHPGAQAVNVPGAWNFSNLHTADPDASARFYTAVFGWEVDDLELGADSATMLRVPGYGDHLEATVDPEIRDRQAGANAPEGYEDAIGWLAPLEPEADRPYWHVTFVVGHRDESVTTAQRLGAEIISTQDSRWNMSAVIRDPQGALLTVSQYAPAR